MIDERDMTDDEIEAMKKIIEGKGYEAMMGSVSKMRMQSYKTFYAWYENKTGMTKHQINEILVDKGIDDYNNVIRPSVRCKTIQDVLEDFKDEIEMTFVDCVGAMQDRGFMVLIKEELGFDNAGDFLDHMGVDND